MAGCFSWEEWADNWEIIGIAWSLGFRLAVYVLSVLVVVYLILFESSSVGRRQTAELYMIDLSVQETLLECPYHILTCQEAKTSRI